MAGNQDRLQENLSASNGPPWAIAEATHVYGDLVYGSSRMP